MAAEAYFDHHRFVASYRSAFARPVRHGSPASSASSDVMPILAPGGARRRSGDMLSEQDSKALLAAYGIAAPAERVVTSAAEAAKAARKLRFPVVMKIVSADIAHKSDLGLVAVGVRDEDDAQRTYRRLVAARRASKPAGATSATRTTTAGFRARLRALCRATGSTSARASKVTTWPQAWTPVSVRPAQVISTVWRRYRSRAAARTPPTVRTPGCRAKPWKPEPS